MTTAATVPRTTERAESQPSSRRATVRARSAEETSRRRFTIAVLVAAGIVLIPYLWLLWDLWNGSANPLRSVPYDNFYDLQARAMFHGRLNLPKGTMGIEAFVHDGRYYTYFGIFPSLIRMPILLLTSSLDGELTAPSLLFAWAVTGIFSSLLLWRLRIIMRGRALLGRAEAVSYGALMAAVLGGSVVLYLGATPFVYNEDFAWSVPLTVGSVFALLGMMEKPSWRRATWCAVLVFATNLNRTPTGYACVIGAGLVAAWFAVGRGGSAERRWALPMLGVAAVSFAAVCAITYAKFGIPVGLPMADQVWATVNAHRRYFLAANGGKAFSVQFLPSTLWAYFQPFGIHATTTFPFFSPPTTPAAWLNGAVLDQTYPTASVPATMPLLFLLGCWGIISAFRPRAMVGARLTRIVLVTAAAGTAGVLLWGYIAERYMADLMPLLILASGVGVIDIWRRLDERGRRVQVATAGTISLVALYCVVANIGIALSPSPQWSPQQTTRFVSAESSLSLSSLSATVKRGARLPYWGPGGELFATDNCSGVYLSTGDDLSNVPGQQIQHLTWLPVSQSPAFTREIGLVFNRPVEDLRAPVPVLTYGSSTLVLEPAAPGYVQLRLLDSGTSVSWPPPAGWPVRILPQELHRRFRFAVTVDPNLNSINVEWYRSDMLDHYIAGVHTPVVKTTPVSATGSTPVVSVSDLRVPATDGTNLCSSLLRAR